MDRWLPYVTGTYTFNDNFNASLGVGYYAYDDSATEDFWELYAGSTVTLDSGAYFTGILLGARLRRMQQRIYEAIGTLGIPFLEKFEAIGKVGYEIMKMTHYASYLWYEARLNYSFNDHVKVGVAYHGNDLSRGTNASRRPIRIAMTYFRNTDAERQSERSFQIGLATVGPLFTTGFLAQAEDHR